MPGRRELCYTFLCDNFRIVETGSRKQGIKFIGVSHGERMTQRISGRFTDFSVKYAYHRTIGRDILERIKGPALKPLQSMDRLLQVKPYNDLAMSNYKISREGRGTSS